MLLYMKNRFEYYILALVRVSIVRVVALIGSRITKETNLWSHLEGLSTLNYSMDLPVIFLSYAN